MSVFAGANRSKIFRCARGFVFSVGLAAAMASTGAACWVQFLRPDARYSVVALLPDLALLVGLLSIFWMAAKNFPRSASVVSLVTCMAWSFAYYSQIQFLLETGRFASRALIEYSVANVEHVWRVAGSGIDVGYLVRISVAAGFIAAFSGLSALHASLERAGFIAGFLAALCVVGTVALPEEYGAITGPLLYGRVENDLPALSGARPTYGEPAILKRSSLERKFPNIVLWIIESGRADLIRADSPDMPPRFLNQIAKESLVFERAYTTTSHTSKALVGILCGHYPHPLMEIVEAAHSGFPLNCLPRILRPLGYTSHFLQAALGAFENRRDLARNLGFDHVVVQEDLGSKYKRAGYLGMDERALFEPLHRATASAAGGPVLITLLTNLTHHPYAMPGTQQPEETAREAYQSVVNYTDGFLSEAFSQISSTINWDQTILFVVGDHGEAFGEHGLYQHDSVGYEEVVRVPLMLRIAGKNLSGADRRLRQTVDVVPTVLDLLGVEWRGNIAGSSLLEEAGHSSVVTSCWPTLSCHSVIFADDMKVVFHFGVAREEVYDLSKDPKERTNLAIRSDTSRVIQEAEARIAWMRAWATSPYQDPQD